MDDESDKAPPQESPGSVAAFGVVAVLVCAGLVALFVWQPWSPSPTGPRPVSVRTDAR